MSDGAAASSPEVERLLEEGRARPSRRLGRDEARVELIAGPLFLLTAGAMALQLPAGRPLSAGTAIALVLGYALASRVVFAVGSGYTDASQLVLVSMLLLLPPEIVPLLVAVALLIGRLPDYARGATHPTRIAFVPGDSLYVVGPALVLALWGEGAAMTGDWPVYLLALAVQIVSGLAVALARDWFRFGVPPKLSFSDMGWVEVVDAILSSLGLLAAVATTDHPYAFVLALPLLALLAIFARERQVRIDQALRLSQAYRGTALLLGDVVDGDDAYTGKHSRGVVEYAVEVADALSLDAHQRRNVEFGALLHDVGKIHIPKQIINKPGPLSVAEWALMRQHTIMGEDMLERVGGVLHEVGFVVRCSHEHFDGGGYPDGLAGDEIPIEARIVSCCDAFSAMTTDRAYRAARSIEDALAELEACAGSQFDPMVVAALVAVVTRRSPDVARRRRSLQMAS